MVLPITGKHPFVEDVARLLGLPYEALSRFEIHFSPDEIVAVTSRVVLDVAQVERLSEIVIRHRILAEESPDGPTPQADRVETA